MSRGLGLAALLVVTGIASTAGAQDLREPAARQGYYLGLGTYFALDANWDEERWYKTWPGFSGNLRLGQGLYDWLDLGLSVDFGFASGTARQAIFGGISAEAQFYPIEDLGIRLATGFAVLSVSEIEAEESDEMGGGIGAVFGIGVAYNWFPFHDEGDSGGFALSPAIQYRLMPREDEISAMVFWVGIELSYWFGLPKNQLELPVEEAFGP